MAWVHASFISMVCGARAARGALRCGVQLHAVSGSGGTFARDNSAAVVLFGRLGRNV